MDLYCGIDLGSRRSHICIVDATGIVQLERSVVNELSSLCVLLGDLPHFA